MLATVLLPSFAAADDLCANRPGLGTPPCVVKRGQVMLETAAADWTRDDDGTERDDRILFADTLVRVGVARGAEVQLGWTPFGDDFVRDRGSRLTERADRAGDVTLGAKLSLRHPDGQGTSLALQPQVTLPLGRRPIGAGDWSFVLAAPFSTPLTDRLTLQATPEVDATPDEAGGGHHLAYGTVVGLDFELTDALDLTAEAQLLRDEDPQAPGTQALGALAGAWRPSARLQLDIGGTVGLNRAAPVLRIYAGLARRF